MQASQLLTREGPTDQEIKIIGVELAITPTMHDGPRREVELEMFACSHTLPASPYGYSHQIRVTLHTSRGDIQLQGQIW